MKEKIYILILNGLSMAWVYITPVHDTLIAISVLVMFDFITGIMCARKEKKKITSKGFRQTISKTFVYQCSIIVALVLEKHLLPGIPVIKIVSSLIAMTETKSFFENVERLTGIDFWSILSDKLIKIIAKGKKK